MDGLVPMACPTLEERDPGLGAVGTPPNGRGVETMESKMTKKPRRSPKSLTEVGVAEARRTISLCQGGGKRAR